MSGWLRIQAKIEETLLAGGILAIACLMVANVVSRSFFGFSLTFAEELSQFLIVLVCFVGLSYAAAQRRHIRMTAFSEQLPLERRLRLGALVAASTSLLLLVFVLLALRYVWVIADLGSVSPVLGVPLYLVYLVAPLGFLLSALQYAGQAYRLLQGEYADLLEPEPDDSDHPADAEP